MSVSDIFKSNFLNNLNAVTPLDMTIATLLAFGMGCFLFLIYIKTFRGVMYNARFGVTLVAMVLITTVLLLAVTSNVMLSLGMVGALSIVRFRTAIKDPMEIAFLFWAIETGIVLASGILLLGVLANIAIGLFLLLFVNRRINYESYILILRLPRDKRAKAMECVNKYTSCKAKRKSETPLSRETGAADDVSDEEPDMIELDLEVRFAASFFKNSGGRGVVSGKTRDNNGNGTDPDYAGQLLDALRKMDIYAVLVKYNGSYMEG